MNYLYTLKTEIMWKYEQEFRIDKPETVGETDKHFDLDSYKDWLEEQLTDCRKQLIIHSVSKSFYCLDKVIGQLECCKQCKDCKDTKF